VRLFCFILIGLIHVNTGNVFGGEDENTAPKTPDRKPLAAPVTSPFALESSPIGGRSPLEERTMNIFGSPLTAGACAGVGTGGGIFCPFTPGTIGTLSNTTSPERAGLNDTWMATAAPCDRSRIETFQFGDYIEECSHGDGLCSAASLEPSPTGPTDIGKPLFSSALFKTKEVELECLNSDGSRETETITVPVTPADAVQFKDRTPLESRFSFPHSAEEEITKDDLSSHALDISLTETPTPHLLEEDFLRVLKKNVSLETLTYGKTLIGPFIHKIHQGLIEKVRTVSDKICGGTGKRKFDNVAAWHILTINQKGRFIDVPGLEPYQHLSFISGEAHLTLEESGRRLKSVSCIPVETHMEKHKTASRSNTMTPCLSPKGIRLKQKDEFPPVAFSDGIITPKVKGETKTDATRNAQKRAWVEKAVSLSYKAFPQTSASILENFLPADARENVDAVREGMLGISTLVDRLKDSQVAQIFGHSEQTMAHTFEKSVMPNVQWYHESVKDDEKVKEVWVVLHSLQDCCWWCSRTLAGLSGLHGDIMVRFIVGGSINFPIFSFKNPHASMEETSSRSELITSSSVDLASIPTIFHYAESESNDTAKK
jgi:hypothetical protein